MRNLIRQPVFQFLVVGALLGGLLYWWTGERAAEDENEIRISTTDVARMQAEWQARWNRPPTQQELDGLVQSQIRERVLYKEAVGMGLDRDEPVIRRVLVQKLERIASDLIELSLSPTDQALQEYFEENAERYRPEPLITLSHVFIDPDKRGNDAVADAEAIVAQLQVAGEGADPREFGDRFLLQGYYPEKTKQRIASLFGQGFAEPVFELEVGKWHGPVLSGYGLHAVFVHSLTEFGVPPFEDVREQVRQDWVDENRKEISEKYYADLMARYDVVIEGQSVESEPTDSESSEVAPES